MCYLKLCITRSLAALRVRVLLACVCMLYFLRVRVLSCLRVCFLSSMHTLSFFLCVCAFFLTCACVLSCVCMDAFFLAYVCTFFLSTYIHAVPEADAVSLEEETAKVSVVLCMYV